MKAYAKLQNKTETDVEKLVVKFNQWADERILDVRNIPVSSDWHQQVINARINVYNWAKENLKRLAKEVLAE